MITAIATAQYHIYFMFFEAKKIGDIGSFAEVLLLALFRVIFVAIAFSSNFKNHGRGISS
jgi:hypothetical protein